MPFLGHWYILLIILAIVLIVYGPGKLPEVGGAVGRAMREFRKASTDFQDEMRKTVATDSPEVRHAPETWPAAETRPAPESRPGADSRPAAEIPPAADTRPAPDRSSTDLTSATDSKV